MREAYRLQVWVPIKADTGEAAIIHMWADYTYKVVAERRAKFLYALSERASTCRTVADFDRAILDILTPESRDIPFALLYHVEKNKTDPSVRPRTHTDIHLRYGGGIGVPRDHPSVPLALDVPVLTSVVDGTGPEQSVDGPEQHSTPSRRYQQVQGECLAVPRADATEPWPFAQALETGRPVYVQDCSAIVEGFPVRVWDELPSSAMVIPIVRSSEAGLPAAVMIVGLSNRLPYDTVYQNYLRE